MLGYFFLFVLLVPFILKASSKANVPIIFIGSYYINNIFKDNLKKKSLVFGTK